MRLIFLLLIIPYIVKAQDFQVNEKNKFVTINMEEKFDNIESVEKVENVEKVDIEEKINKLVKEYDAKNMNEALLGGQL